MNDNATPDRRVAVIGSGVAGLVAAHVCAKTAQVTLYEADPRLGGHADTHDVPDGDRTLRIDTGFIVHNRRTYPVLCRLFDELGVPTQESEMSMSVSDDFDGLEWAGARGLTGLLPSWRHLTSPRHLRMLGSVLRFHRAAQALLDTPGEAGDQTLRAFVDEHGFPPYFVRHYLEPLVAAVWSCDPQIAGDYPARYLFQFLEHHGMLSVNGSPRWRTVTGGSREYVRRVAEGIQEIRTGCPVMAVRDTGSGVEITDANGDAVTYDAVVIATHPHQALSMLKDPTAEQEEVLGAMPYSGNPALLHTDTRLMPRNRRIWSSWNFRRVRETEGPVTVTYDLTRLQSLDTDTHYLVTLGGEDLVDPETVIARMDYEHPVYNPETLAAQSRLPEVETERLAFAGAYHGWGFHEDGARSGLEAARRLGFEWLPGSTRPASAQVAEEEPTVPLRDNGSPEPVVYDAVVRHTRFSPWRRSFRHRSAMWVVDVDAVDSDRRSRPVRSFFRGSIRASDHLGDPTSTLRRNVEDFLHRHGIELGDAQVLLATKPRALGHCFNPISVFWCLLPDGSPLATVVEVHNTYGDRHAYLMTPDDRASATVDKQMYVSPFYGVDGSYELVAPVPADRLSLVVNLTTGTGERFTASLQGRRAGKPGLSSTVASLRDTARIRLHGLRLWARGLPVQPRPAHHQEGV